jgi:hypothetical protein
VKAERVPKEPSRARDKIKQDPFNNRGTDHEHMLLENYFIHT